MPSEDLTARDERFWAKVDRREPDECWLWTAATDSVGYGLFWNPTRRTMDLAHRYAFARCVRPLRPKPPGTLGAAGETICHSCDNPPCVNPRHLFAATQKENMADMRAKGRQPDNRGVRNPRARLTREQAQEARKLYTGQYGEIAALARRFGVSHGAMSHAIHGRSWT